jgi:hypothetical protein
VYALRPVFDFRAGGQSGAICATEEPAVDLDSMPDDLAIAVFAYRGHCLNGTFKAVERMAGSGRHDLEALVIIIAAHFTPSHT